jgi:hypothetical protein
MKYKFSLILFTLAASTAMAQDKIYKTAEGKISFVSNAPLEIIAAKSGKMEGIIDAGALTFAFSVVIQTFDGFNNGLQKQHFNENYLETNKYPTATFSGKIIEHIDISKPGTYQVRAKGQLNIHGRSKERILRVDLISNGVEIKANASFMVPLIDHQIEVPRIVNQKIAQEIAVTVQATLALEGKS